MKQTFYFNTLLFLSLLFALSACDHPSEPSLTDKSSDFRASYAIEETSTKAGCSASFAIGDGQSGWVKLSGRSRVYCNDVQMVTDENSFLLYYYKATIPKSNGKYVVNFVQDGISYPSEVETIEDITLLNPKAGAPILRQRSLDIQWEKGPRGSSMGIRIDGNTQNAHYTTNEQRNGPPETGSYQFSDHQMTIPNAISTVTLSLKRSQNGKLAEELKKGTFQLNKSKVFNFPVQ